MALKPIRGEFIIVDSLPDSSGATPLTIDREAQVSLSGDKIGDPQVSGQVSFPTPTLPADIESAALQAVGRFLESKGWNPLVISANRIQGPLGPKYLHEIVFRFTGSAPKGRPRKGSGSERKHPPSSDKDESLKRVPKKKKSPI